MNLPYFISKRINHSQRTSFSSTIYRIAVASIALGVAISIISFLILLGFQNTILNKIYNFGSHIQVTKYSLNNSYERLPISTNTEIYKNYEEIPFIEHVQAFANKGCLLKTDDAVEGVLLKGVDRGFDKYRFEQYIVKGRFLNPAKSGYSNEVVISSYLSNRLLLNVGDDILAYFIQNPPRVRKLQVVGLYETGLEDFDQRLIIGDLALIQRLNDWGDTLVGGFEIFIDDTKNLEHAEAVLYNEVDYDLFVEKISDVYLQIFDWLGLLGRNVYIFLGLILFVASFNIISILLILIMERTPMIGTLKALGATNEQVRKIFLFNGLLIIFRGMIIGNFLAISLCALQYYFRIIPLDPLNYYMSYVPVEWNWQAIVLINLTAFTLVTLVLLVPTAVVSSVNPIKSMRFS